MPKAVSVIIRTKNEERDIGKTLSILQCQKMDYNLDIIVVDSGSTDHTVEIAKRYNAHVIKISSSMFSWGRALNIGLSAAEGEYAFLMSAHCFLIDETALQLALDLMKAKNIDVLYGKQIGDPEKNIYECAEMYIDYPDYENELPKNGRLHGISNACCLLRHDVWKENRFDENLQSSEDAEWFLRLLKKPYNVVYTNKLILIHGHKNDAKYIYKRNFWREYTNLQCFNRNLSGIKRNGLYNGITRILHIFYIYFFYMRILKKLSIKYKARGIIKYVFLKDFAVYMARMSYFKNAHILLGYEEINVPLIVTKINI